MKFLFMLYRRQRNNYVVRKRRILAAIILKLQKRKQLFLKLLNLIKHKINLLETLPQKRMRRTRRFQRNNVNWSTTVSKTYSDEGFRQTFRVSRPTFYFVLSKIEHRIRKEFAVEAPVNPDQRFAICLYRLARGDYLYTVGEMVGLAESTVYQMVAEVCTTIIEELWSETLEIHFPKTNDEFKEKLLDMDAEWKFPYAFAAIDGSNLPIKCPSGGQEVMKQYYNFKNLYSVVLLGIVDANYIFIWTSLRAPGNTHNSACFQSTSLWDDTTSGKTLPGQVVEVNGVEIPPIILGDSAFPLQSWMMKPHGDAVLTQEKAYFNFCLRRAGMVTEGAFGKLKGRFRVLHRKCESNKETVKKMGLACVVLRNLCIDKGDFIPRKFDLTFDHMANKCRDRTELRDILHLTNSNRPNYADVGRGRSIKVRNAITQIFWDEKNNIN